MLAVPANVSSIFFKSKFIIKYKHDKIITNKEIFPVGVCLLKKEIAKIIGRKNQYILEFVFMAKIKNSKEIIESMEAWWSTKGVPADGYAKIAINKEYSKQ